MKSTSKNQIAFNLGAPAKLLRDPNERALRLRQVSQLTGLGRSMIYQMQAEGRFPLTYLCNSKKNRQRSIDRDERVLVQSADCGANLVAGHRLRLVYHDLRILSKAIVGIWLNRNSQQRGGAQLAGDWQNSH